LSDWRKQKTTLDDKDSILNLLNKHKFISGECWRVNIDTDRHGYARLRVGDKLYYVHRLSLYVFKNFDLNSDLLVLHKPECKYTDCWNPDHLHIGDQGDNMTDLIIKNSQKLEETTFRCGHPKNVANTKIAWGRYIQCRLCHNERNRSLYWRIKKESKINAT